MSLLTHTWQFINQGMMRCHCSNIHIYVEGKKNLLRFFQQYGITFFSMNGGTIKQAAQFSKLERKRDLKAWVFEILEKVYQIMFQTIETAFKLKDQNFMLYQIYRCRCHQVINNFPFYTLLQFALH